MNTDSSHQIEINPEELIGAFLVAFWPVSLIVALFEYLFYDGHGAIPISTRSFATVGHGLSNQNDRKSCVTVASGTSRRTSFRVR